MPVALITGASSGIGAALARELAARGWSVGLVARRVALLHEAARDLAAPFAVAEADVTDRDAVERAVGTVVDALGPIDLVVANAGRGGPRSVLEQGAFAELHAMLDVNVHGVVNTVGAVLPAMSARGSGHLCLISSLAATRGIVPDGGYAASKAAASVWFEALRVELAPRGIDVTTVHPWFVDTPMTAGATHPMPLRVPVDRAARIVADGLARRRRRIDFPWLPALMMRGVAWLPDVLFDTAMRRVASLADQ